MEGCKLTHHHKCPQLLKTNHDQKDIWTRFLLRHQLKTELAGNTLFSILKKEDLSILKY